MTSAIFQLVYMPNFRAIGQTVWEKNGNRHTDSNTDSNTERHTDLNFINIKKLPKLASIPRFGKFQRKNQTYEI